VKGFVTLMLGLLLLAAGIAQAPGVVIPLPPEDQQRIAAQLGPGVVGNALPSKPITDVSAYFPLTNRSLTTRSRVARTRETLSPVRSQE
jgi:hypothetical protein